MFECAMIITTTTGVISNLSMFTSIIEVVQWPRQVSHIVRPANDPSIEAK